MLGIKPDSGSAESSQEGWIGPAPWIRTALPGPKAKALIQRDKPIDAGCHYRDYPLVVQRASGSVIEDVDGNRFLDCEAGIAVCATGHCHPQVIAAIEAQVQSLIHANGNIFYYPQMTALLERLNAIAPGDKPKRVFLASSGAEAVEAAIKISRFHTKRQWIIGFHGAFHGRTLGALALTYSKARQQVGFGAMLPMVAHVPFGDVEAIESILFRHKMDPEEAAAVFVEPLQGEGGYIMPEPSFFPDLRALCDKHGILLVCDEIQTGVGRTGRWFASEHFNTVPDITLVAKGIASGMPLSAVIADADIMSWPSGSHGSTFGGNPVCCAAALATLDLVESTYMANAATQGKNLLAGLQQIVQKHDILRRPRGLGLMGGVDVVTKKADKPDPETQRRILTTCFERGLILLPCGVSGIRFCPPLCINETQLDVALKIFDESVSTVA